MAFLAAFTLNLTDRLFFSDQWKTKAYNFRVMHSLSFYSFQYVYPGSPLLKIKMQYPLHDTVL